MKITNYKPFFGNVVRMIPMGQYVEKRGTVAAYVSKVFAGVQGAVFSKSASWLRRIKCQ
jgi:hypothetical protein